MIQVKYRSTSINLAYRYGR